MANIIVAFSKQEDGRKIKNILIKNGSQVTATCTSGSQALALAGDLEGGIVVSGFRFGDMGCLQLNARLPADFKMLLVASPSRWSGENMGEIICLPAPFKVCDLVSTVRMMEQLRTEKKRKKRSEPIKRTEEEMRLIEQAKALLIERNQMTESEAHRYLQKCSMESGTGMAEAARMALSLGELW